MSASTVLNRRNNSLAGFLLQHYGPNGTYSEIWRQRLLRDPEGQQIYMLIDLVFGGGQRLRVATRPIRLIGTDGHGDREFAALLQAEPSIEHRSEIGQGVSSARSFTVGIIASQIADFATGLNPWQSILRGFMLAGWGEVSLAYDGMEYRHRLVLMRGDMSSGVEFGALKDVIQTEISDPKITTDFPITPYVTDHDPDDIVSPLPDSSVGLRYPLVIGRFDMVPGLRLSTSGVSPMFMCTVGHEHKVTAAFVDGVSYAEASTVYPWSFSQERDFNGVTYLSLNFSAGSGVWEETTSVHATVERLDDTYKTVVSTIKTIAEEWSGIGPTGLAEDLFGDALARIQGGAEARVCINGSGEQDAANALEYIESTLTEPFPMISMAWGSGGYGPVLTDRRLPAEDVLIVGKGMLLKRSSPWVETPKEALFNTFTLRYQYNPIDDIYEKVITRDPTNSMLCKISEDQIGKSTMDPIETPVIQDDQTAAYSIEWMVAHLALPSHYAEFDAHGSAMVRLRLGMPVALVPEPIDGADVTIANPLKGTVEVIQYTRGACTVGIRVWALYDVLGGGAAS